MHILNNRHIRLTPDKRLFKCSVPIIGLTGGIATGKSTVSKYLSDKNFNIIDADQLIRNIYQKSETIDFIRSIAPQVIENNTILFPKLRDLFFNHAEIKKEIEQFLYAQIPEQFDITLKQSNLEHANFIFYDVPLLYEKNLTSKVDQTIVVYSPQNLQIERLMARDQPDLKLAKNIINQQFPIEEKKNLADFTLDNTSSLKKLYSGIDQIIKNLCE